MFDVCNKFITEGIKINTEESVLSIYGCNIIDSKLHRLLFRSTGSVNECYVTHWYKKKNILHFNFIKSSFGQSNNYNNMNTLIIISAILAGKCQGIASWETLWEITVFDLKVDFSWNFFSSASNISSYSYERFFKKIHLTTSLYVFYVFWESFNTYVMNVLARWECLSRYTMEQDCLVENRR